MAVDKGIAHFAGCHLLDPDTGEFSGRRMFATIDEGFGRPDGQATRVRISVATNNATGQNTAPSTAPPVAPMTNPPPV